MITVACGIVGIVGLDVKSLFLFKLKISKPDSRPVFFSCRPSLLLFTSLKNISLRFPFLDSRPEPPSSPSLTFKAGNSSLSPGLFHLELSSRSHSSQLNSRQPSLYGISRGRNFLLKIPGAKLQTRGGTSQSSGSKAQAKF